MDKVQSAYLAGGCFWCVEAVFLRVAGVIKVVSGYMGGHVPNPTYQQICTSQTGHAEVVRVDFDPQKITYQQLLEVFFQAHDPTTINRQGNDVGSQYRSEIFCVDEKQQQIANQTINKLKNSFTNPIVTRVSSLQPFYQAEEYHQNYYNLNSEQPYCRLVISPKLKKLYNEHEN